VHVLFDPLENREMVQHVQRRHLGINAELLRQIAEDLASRYLGTLNSSSWTVQVRSWRGCDGAHQRALTRSVEAEQTEHVIADGQ
jgi:hypothetical protein